MVQPGAPGSGGGSSGREPGPYEEPSLLVVILDADPASWAQLHGKWLVSLLLLRGDGPFSPFCLFVQKRQEGLNTNII